MIICSESSLPCMEAGTASYALVLIFEFNLPRSLPSIHSGGSRPRSRFAWTGRSDVSGVSLGAEGFGDAWLSGTQCVSPFPAVAVQRMSVLSRLRVAWFGDSLLACRITLTSGECTATWSVLVFLSILPCRLLPRQWLFRLEGYRVCLNWNLSLRAE